MLLISLSLVILTVYTSYAVWVCGVPASLSSTYYLLKRRGCPYWLFQVAMVLTGGLLLPSWLDVSDSSFQFLAFLSCGALCFVGAAPMFRCGLDRGVHITATAVAGFSSLFWAITSGYWYLPLGLLSVSAVYGIYSRKPLFWMEMAAFAWTYLCVINEILKGGV